jgi:hypothetical protein
MVRSAWRSGGESTSSVSRIHYNVYTNSLITTYTLITTVVHYTHTLYQWWSVPFKMREGDSFHVHGLISITAYWMSVIHIPLHSLYNSDWFRLLYDTQFFSVPIVMLLQLSLWMKVYNVGAHRSRQKFELTDSDTFNTPLHTLAWIELI